MVGDKVVQDRWDQISPDNRPTPLSPRAEMSKSLKETNPFLAVAPTPSSGLDNDNELTLNWFLDCEFSYSG